jgi:hypothetical protein
LLLILRQLFANFTGLNDLTIPYPDHTLTLQMLSMPRNMVCLRLTHEHPTVPMILKIADLCPHLRELFFSFFGVNVGANSSYFTLPPTYFVQRPLWILNEGALVCAKRISAEASCSPSIHPD